MKIKLIGVGGCGCNTVNSICRRGTENVECAVDQLGRAFCKNR